MNVPMISCRLANWMDVVRRDIKFIRLKEWVYWKSFQWYINLTNCLCGEEQVRARTLLPPKMPESLPVSASGFFSGLLGLSGRSQMLTFWASLTWGCCLSMQNSTIHLQPLTRPNPRDSKVLVHLKNCRRLFGLLWLKPGNCASPWLLAHSPTSFTPETPEKITLKIWIGNIEYWPWMTSY